MYSIILDKSVDKFLQKHRWEPVINQFERALDIIKEDPFKNNLDIKPFESWSDNYRLRIWNIDSYIKY